MTWLVCLYPRWWRERYEDEFLFLLHERPFRLRDVPDLLRAIADARLHRPHLQRTTAPHFLRKVRPTMLLKLLVAGVSISGLTAGSVLTLASPPRAHQTIPLAAARFSSRSSVHSSQAAETTGLICPLNAYISGCQAPPNGIVRPVQSGPQAGSFITLPASAVSFPIPNLVVKSAVGSPAINDQQQQAVIGQLLVNYRPVSSVPMTAIWQYRGGTSSCSAVSDQSGIAQCSEPALAFQGTDGAPVQIQLHFTYQGHDYSSTTSYTPFSD